MICGAGAATWHEYQSGRSFRDTHVPRRFFSMVGTVQHMAFYCARIDRERAKGTRWAKRVFRPAA
jgi:hypothetical protein